MLVVVKDIKCMARLKQMAINNFDRAQMITNKTGTILYSFNLVGFGLREQVIPKDNAKTNFVNSNLIKIRIEITH